MDRTDFMALPPIRKTAIYDACASMRTPGLCIEFGVWKGGSLNYLADLLHPDKIFGFDSFEGLPEDWSMGGKFHPKGTFRTDLPQVRGNAELVPGWFSDTLPRFLKEHPEPVSLLHIDSDLYSSAKYVLTMLNDRISVGTVIMFDELCDFTDGEQGYPDWRNGEWKALQEWLSEKKRSVRPLFRNNDWRAAVVVTD